MWCETDNQATTPFSYSLNTAFLPVRPHCTNARQNRCQEDLNSFPLENWRRPPGRPLTKWMKTTPQDLKSNNLSLKKAIDVAQNCHCGDWCLCLVMCTSSSSSNSSPRNVLLHWRPSFSSSVHHHSPISSCQLQLQHCLSECQHYPLPSLPSKQI